MSALARGGLLMPIAHLDESAARKGFRQGTHRLVPPGDTLEKVRRHLPAMGITRVANVTGLTAGLMIGF